MTTHPTHQQDKGFASLAAVQVLGVVLAIGLTLYIRDDYTHPGWMLIVVVALLALTILVAACQQDLAPVLWGDVGGNLPGPSFLYRFNLSTAHKIYFLADFGVLAFLIHVTGGPQHSLYATFLFVLVPTSIALGKPSVTTVVTFAGITLFIFLTLLVIDPPKDFTLAGNGDLDRKIWLGVVTTACVLFPTLVYCIQKWKPRNTARGVPLQQTTVKTSLISTADHSSDSIAGVMP